MNKSDDESLSDTFVEGEVEEPAADNEVEQEEEEDEEPEVVYYGERKCEASRGSGKPCTNNAYFAQTKKRKKGTTGRGDETVYLCGVHAKDKLGRRGLPKRDPKERKRREQQRNEADRLVVEQHRQRNEEAGRRGDVVLEPLRMLKAPEHREGYLRVYPNFKHQNKADGFGCMRLSPMSLGPVEHGQPGLPPSLNIENFHQGTKVFREELDRDGNPSSLYVKNRLRFYKDPVPHRHKYRGAKGANGGNRNVPVFFLWLDRDGSEHRLSYVQSRQFYCTFYERLAAQEADFAHLLDLHERGTNLQLCGYDAHPLRPGQTIEDAYLDPSVPFGHERVLYAMLLLHDRPDEYPWRKHKTFDF